MASKVSGYPSKVVYQEPDLMILNEDGFVGTLDVYVHHARDVHNICIYHKQDVYAKLCLTSDPDITLSTRTINGGGRNPVFDENLQLNVRTVESSLKCEIWMLSRVRNYLEDQLLGFALVPLSEVIVGGRGRLTEREFSLSSTDLFHSPAGFVQLSLSYVGFSPKISVAAPSLFPPSSTVSDATLADSESGDTIPSEIVKMEFPDIKVVKENQLMVSEYFGIPCESLDSPCQGSLITSEVDDYPDHDAGFYSAQSFSTGSEDTTGAANLDSPPSCISVSSGHRVTVPEASQSSPSPSGATTEATESPSSMDKSPGMKTGEVESSESRTSNGFKPVVTVNIEPEQTVIQQDIIDKYMKSMQQFTESLAKMKLPLDIEKNSSNGENAKPSSEKKIDGSKENASRVFYGSRAFF